MVNTKGASTIKCVLVGDSRVGKSSLVTAYLDHKFSEEYLPNPTECEERRTKEGVVVRNQKYNFELIIVNGTEDYRHKQSFCYSEADVLLVCFSVDCPSSYHNAKVNWLREVSAGNRGIPKLIVGTKTDLRSDQATIKTLSEKKLKPLTYDMGVALAKQHKAVAYSECSAVTREGVEDVFDKAFSAAIDSHPPAQSMCCDSCSDWNSHDCLWCCISSFCFVCLICNEARF